MIAISKMNLDTVAAHKYADNHRCGDCNSSLTVAWVGAWGINEYVIRCGENIDHDSIIEVDLTAYYQELHSKFGRRNKKLAQQIGTSKEIALRKYEYLPRLNKEEAKEVITTLWPNASPQTIQKAIMICVQYRLNPLLKQVYILSFKKWKDGKVIGTTEEVVLGIGATRQITAQTAGKYSFVGGTPRVMTKTEQETTFGQYDPDNLWVYTLLRDGQGNEFPGYGFWPRDTEVKGADKGNSVFNMASIRSERNAANKMAPGALPSDVAVMDEQYLDKPAPNKVTIERTVDTQTGEIIEGESQEVTEEGQNADFEQLNSNGGHSTEPEVKYNIDLEWLNESLKKLVFEKSFPSWVKSKVPRIEIKNKTVSEIAAQFTTDEATLVVAGLRERAEIGKVQLT